MRRFIAGSLVFVGVFFTTSLCVQRAHSCPTDDMLGNFGAERILLYESVLVRTKTPGGWLVHHPHTFNLCYVPDPNHDWHKQQPEKQ